MTDEARIARLTELARRVWPHLEEQKVIAETSGGAMIAYLSPIPLTTFDGTEGERYVSYHTRILQHPRALDALEAALLVLANETPAWVEQLATDIIVNKGIYQDAEEACEDIARDLRERARGGA